MRMRDGELKRLGDEDLEMEIGMGDWIKSSC